MKYRVQLGVHDPLVMRVPVVRHNVLHRYITALRRARVKRRVSLRAGQARRLIVHGKGVVLLEFRRSLVFEGKVPIDAQRWAKGSVKRGTGAVCERGVKERLQRAPVRVRLDVKDVRAVHCTVGRAGKTGRLVRVGKSGKGSTCCLHMRGHLLALLGQKSSGVQLEASCDQIGCRLGQALAQGLHKRHQIRAFARPQDFRKSPNVVFGQSERFDLGELLRFGVARHNFAQALERIVETVHAVPLPGVRLHAPHFEPLQTCLCHLLLLGSSSFRLGVVAVFFLLLFLLVVLIFESVESNIVVLHILVHGLVGLVHVSLVLGAAVTLVGPVCAGLRLQHHAFLGVRLRHVGTLQMIHKAFKYVFLRIVFHKRVMQHLKYEMH